MVVTEVRDHKIYMDRYRGKVVDILVILSRDCLYFFSVIHVYTFWHS